MKYWKKQYRELPLSVRFSNGAESPISGPGTVPGPGLSLIPTKPLLKISSIASFSLVDTQLLKENGR